MKAMARCHELEPLLAERASGALAPAEEARVAVHLVGCAPCRAEAAAYAEALSIAMPRLAPVTDAELSSLAAAALAAIRPSERPARFLRWWLGAGLAATAAAAVALAPMVLRDRPSPGSVSSLRWEAPDPDALWRAAGPPIEDVDDEGDAGAPLFAAYDGAELS
jgi:anti-sigma factor RsiW